MNVIRYSCAREIWVLQFCVCSRCEVISWLSRWRDGEIANPIRLKPNCHCMPTMRMVELSSRLSSRDSLAGFSSRCSHRTLFKILFKNLTKSLQDSKTFSKNLAKTPENCLLNYLLNCFEQPTRSLGSSQQVRRLAWIVSSISQSEECEDPAHVRPAAERSCFQSKISCSRTWRIAGFQIVWDIFQMPASSWEESRWVPAEDICFGFQWRESLRFSSLIWLIDSVHKISFISLVHKLDHHLSFISFNKFHK